RALKLLDDGSRQVIAEGKCLHHEHRAYSPGGIDPEERVVGTSPGERAAGATACNRLRVHAKSQAKLVDRTGYAYCIFGNLRDQARQHLYSQVDNLVATHLADRPRVEDPLAAEFSASEQHLLELQVIAGCRKESPATAIEPHGLEG